MWAAIRAEPKTAHLPVLLASAVSEQEEASRLAEQHGADGFLPDTISSDGLVEAVKAALARGDERR